MNFVKIFLLSAPPKADEKTKEAEKPAPIETVKVGKTGNVTLIGINRAEVRNCINSVTAQLLSLEIEKFENDPESPVAILYGVGGNFCAGYDLKELKETEAGLILKSEGALVRNLLSDAGNIAKYPYLCRDRHEDLSRNL